MLTSQIGDMVLIRPQESEGKDSQLEKQIRKLRILHDCLKKEKGTVQKIANAGNDDSLRRIQCNRYELLLRDNSSTYERLRDEYLAKDDRLSREELQDFVRQQALKGDPRLDESYVFGTFSIIITYGRVEQQVPHIDLVSPNYQCGLVLSDGAPGTLIYESTTPYADNTSVVDAVHEMWKANTDISDTLYQALSKNQDVRKQLSDFGRLLLPFELVQESKIAKLSTASLLSTPGSVIHAGPACKGFRAIIFCSAWPSTPGQNAAAPYDPDVQSTKPLLWCKLICCVWGEVPLGDREYLLTELAGMIRRKEHPDLELLILEPQIYDFIVAIKQTAIQNKQSALISKYAAIDDFCFVDVETAAVDSDESEPTQCKRQRIE